MVFSFYWNEFEMFSTFYCCELELLVFFMNCCYYSLNNSLMNYHTFNTWITTNRVLCVHLCMLQLWFYSLIANVCSLYNLMEWIHSTILNNNGVLFDYTKHYSYYSYFWLHDTKLVIIIIFYCITKIFSIKWTWWWTSCDNCNNFEIKKFYKICNSAISLIKKSFNHVQKWHVSFLATFLQEQNDYIIVVDIFIEKKIDKDFVVLCLFFLP